MVGIIILNYITYQDTIKLVEELQNQTIASRLKIVVVDNHSPNGSYLKLRELESRFENVVVLQTNENLGYAKGNNWGLRYLEESDKPNYVAILNNDVTLESDTLERLELRYTELDRAAVISPVMVDSSGKRHIPFRANRFVDDIISLSSLLRTILPNRSRQKEADNTGKRAMKCELIQGSFMFVNFELFKSLGYFYPNTFLYAEERFIYHKVKEKGLQNYLILDQTYLHAVGSPTISLIHTQSSKYRMLYKEWLEYTRVCRRYGKLKAAIMWPLTKLSVFEWQIVSLIKSITNRDV